MLFLASPNSIIQFIIQDIDAILGRNIHQLMRPHQIDILFLGFAAPIFLEM